MQGEQRTRSGGGRERGRRQAQRLVAAYEHLEATLEVADVEQDPGVADAVIAAIAATDRAYRLAMGRSER